MSLINDVVGLEMKDGLPKCRCCKSRIYNNKGVYWAKAHDFSGGTYSDSIDPSTIYFVCKDCSPTFPRKEDCDYPWVYDNLPLTFTSRDFMYCNGATVYCDSSTIDGGYVYLLKAGDRYKIGTTDTIHKRIKALQTSCPYKIEVVLVVKSSDALTLEKTTHKLFKAHRRVGEWFEFDSKSLNACVDFLSENGSKVLLGEEHQ